MINNRMSATLLADNLTTCSTGAAAIDKDGCHRLSECYLYVSARGKAPPASLTPISSMSWGFYMQMSFMWLQLLPTEFRFL